MPEKTVKLTVRLPTQLHRVLKERAVEYHVSLNQAVIDTLTAELAPESHEETEAEKFDRMLRESGLLAKTDWMDKYIEGADIPSLEEVRAWLGGVPLSDWIIEDRGPR